MTEQEMREAIARVRELHKPVKTPNEIDYIEYICEECLVVSGVMEFSEYPCRTIKALDDDE